MPFHMICTPMHIRMNADNRITTASPVAPRVRCSRSAKAKQKYVVTQTMSAPMTAEAAS